MSACVVCGFDKGEHLALKSFIAKHDLLDILGRDKSVKPVGAEKEGYLLFLRKLDIGDICLDGGVNSYRASNKVLLWVSLCLRGSYLARVDEELNEGVIL